MEEEPKKGLLSTEAIEQAREQLLAARQAQEASIDGAVDADRNLRDKLRQMDAEVRQHPELSELEKLAWLRALKLSGQGQGIEAKATQLADKYKTIETAVAEPGVPIMVWPLYPQRGERVSFYVTTGQGLEAVIGEHSYFYELGAEECVEDDFPGGEVHHYVAMDDLENTIMSPEELEKEEPIPVSPDAGNHILGRGVLVIGEETIVRFAEKLYSPENDRHFSPGSMSEVKLRLNERAMLAGINLEERLEAAKKFMDEHRDIETRRVATPLLESLVSGYDINLEHFQAEAKARSISLSAVFDFAELRLKAGTTRLQNLRKELDAKETEAVAEPEPAQQS